MTAVRSLDEPTPRVQRRRRPTSSTRPLSQESAGSRRRAARKPADAHHSSWRNLVVGCVVGLFAALGLTVYVQGERIQAQERADDLAAQIERAQVQQRELGVDLARAASPERVMATARAAGMVDPGPVAAVASAPVAPSEPLPSAPFPSEPPTPAESGIG